MSVSAGDMAPEFKLPTDGGGELELQALRGKKVVLYFYPKDSTPGCTTEAQDFRNLMPEFEAVNAVIVGASKDSIKRHDNFKTKQQLNFPLVSDVEGTLCEAYGVWQEKKNYGRSYMGIVRSTFLIDEEGKIEQVWRNLRVKGHAAAVLETITGDA